MAPGTAPETRKVWDHWIPTGMACRLSQRSIPKGGTKWPIIHMDDDNGWCAPRLRPRPFVIPHLHQ